MLDEPMFYVFTYNNTKYWLAKPKYESLPEETKKQFKSVAERSYIGYEYTEWK